MALVLALAPPLLAIVPAVVVGVWVEARVEGLFAPLLLGGGALVGCYVVLLLPWARKVVRELRGDAGQLSVPAATTVAVGSEHP